MLKTKETRVDRDNTLSTLLLAFSLACFASPGFALDLEDLPLSVSTNVPPNVVVSFDDSGSMLWGFLPDSIERSDDASDEPEAKSSKYNKIYYDPTVSYRPPMNHLGAEYPEANFTSAEPDFFGDDGNEPGPTANVNLSTSFRPPWNFFGYTGSYGPHYATDNGSGAGQPAYYYQFDEVNCNDSQIRQDSCYTKVVVSSTSGPSRVRPELGDIVSTDERTNFANWYQFYSYRMLAGKTALSRAFGPDKISSNTRVARQTINRRGPESGDPGSSNTAGPAHVAELTEQQREYFYDWLWGVSIGSWSVGTPLRHATNAVGNHYSQGGTNSPYSVTPGTAVSTSNPEVSCRVNSHILLTDGNWNQGEPGITYRDDEDGVDLPETIGGITEYNASSADHEIYENDESRLNLADIAFNYWVSDLRSDLDNDLTPFYPETSSADGQPVYPADFWNPANDPATWQHMVNYMVAFGTAGLVPLTDTAYNSLLTGTSYTDNEGDAATGWTDTDTENYRSDDVYHAAINSRGAFFSAQNPDALVAAFSEISDRIESREANASPVVVNSGSISTDSLVYLAKFDTESWTGQLLAYTVSDGSEFGVSNPVSSCNSKVLGTLCSQAWNAATQNNADTINHATRKVFTYKSTASLGGDPAGSGIDFKWGASTDLSTAQQALLNDGDGLGSKRVDYLRGDGSEEGTLFRLRADAPNTTFGSRLGAIVHSSPVYVGSGVDVNNTRQFNFPDDLESQSYSAFLTSIANRKPMIYVGANDGMLHAINAQESSVAGGGSEVFAYVPNEIIKDLPELTETSFRTGAFVDGQLAAQDVFWGSSWKTLLVGGLRSGGQGYFALDVTDPTATAASMVKWEFTDENDVDMGYTYGQPQLVRANNGEWVVLVGNGYNSTEADGRQGSGDGVLYVLAADDGEMLAKISVGNSSGANGLSGPVAVSANGDYNADYVYAGDLEGNLWKIDISSADPADWDNASNTTLLFSAGSSQPITASPTVGTHPTNSGGRVVYVGTGQYVEKNDITSTATQAFYAIWDKDSCSGSPCVSLGSLVSQTVSAPSTTRTTSENPIDWGTKLGWYLSLSGGTSIAERVIGKASVLGGVIVFVTVVPDDDICDSGGSSYLFALDRNTGGSYEFQLFDTNNNGVIDQLDKVSGNVANVVKIDDIATQGVYVSANSSSDGTLYVGETSNLFGNFGKVGRIRWRQLK